MANATATSSILLSEVLEGFKERWCLLHSEQETSLPPKQIQLVLERVAISLPDAPRSYCTQLVNETLEHKVLECIKALSFYQTRLKLRQPAKYRARLRLAIGLKEVIKFANSKRLCGLFVAIDIDTATCVEKNKKLGTMLQHALKRCEQEARPVIFACRQEDLARVLKGRRGLHHVAAVGVISADGAHDVFMECVRMGDILRCEWESWFEKVLYYRNQRHESPLWVMCYEGFFGSLKWMICLGEDSTRWSSDKKKSLLEDADIIHGWTPFLVAVAQGHMECVEWCLQVDCDKMVKDLQERTAIWLACENNDVVMLTFLMSHGILWVDSRRLLTLPLIGEMEVDPFGYSIAYGHIELLKCFVKNNQDHVHICYGTETTPLMLACLCDQAAVVRFLVSHGHYPHGGVNRNLWMTIIRHDRVACFRALIDRFLKEKSLLQQKEFLQLLYVETIPMNATRVAAAILDTGKVDR
jgi:hypothetical protein